MGIVISVVNQKGGVGKTTTTVNVGAALAERGFSVLLVDIDPQSNLSTHLGLNTQFGEFELAVEEDPEPSIYDVLKGRKTLKEVIHHRNESSSSSGSDSANHLKSQDKSSGRLDIVPSSLFLSAADLELGGVVGRELILKRALEPVRNDYDYILIDCPPALGLLSLNALAASEQVIVPV